MLPFLSVPAEFVLEVLVEHLHRVFVVADTTFKQLRHNQWLLPEDKTPLLFKKLSPQFNHRSAGQLLAPENHWARLVFETGHLEGGFQPLCRLFVLAAIDTVFSELNCNLAHHTLDPFRLKSFFEGAACRLEL